VRNTTRTGRLEPQRFWPLLICAAAVAGCAGLPHEGDDTPAQPELPPPRLVDESLICELLEEPELIHSEQPDYPAEARKHRSSGEVVVEAIITREGTIRNPRIVRATHPAFIDPVLTALERWRYRPARCDEIPVEMVFHIYMRFWIP
jgi:protein TonB